MVVTVRVDDCGEASVIMIEEGLKIVVESFDWPLTLNEMVPVNPPVGVAVIV